MASMAARCRSSPALTRPRGQPLEPRHPYQPEHQEAYVLDPLPVYGVPDLLLALLPPVPARRSLRYLMAEFHQEHSGGYMSVALIVSPRQAGELYHVAADQTGIAEPDALIRIDA